MGLTVMFVLLVIAGTALFYVLWPLVIMLRDVRGRWTDVAIWAAGLFGEVSWLFFSIATNEWLGIVVSGLLGWMCATYFLVVFYSEATRHVNTAHFRQEQTRAVS